MKTAIVTLSADIEGLLISEAIFLNELNNNLQSIAGVVIKMVRNDQLTE
tara:strand:+ start:26325 stop:26471 length:147 start_codon:yes stop_codon:yes gene_type:complete